MDPSCVNTCWFWGKEPKNNAFNERFNVTVQPIFHLKPFPGRLYHTPDLQRPPPRRWSGGMSIPTVRCARPPPKCIPGRQATNKEPGALRNRSKWCESNWNHWDYHWDFQRHGLAGCPGLVSRPAPRGSSRPVFTVRAPNGETRAETKQRHKVTRRGDTPGEDISKLMQHASSITLSQSITFDSSTPQIPRDPVVPNLRCGTLLDPTLAVSSAEPIT